MSKRRPTKYKGVYERESEKKLCKGKPDICYDISYKHRTKLVWKKVGWASEGYTAKLAEVVRGDRIRSIRHGDELPQEQKKIPFFKDAAKKYIEWAKENITRNGYDDINRYKNHLAPEFDNQKLDEISPFGIERFKKKLSQKGLSPGTTKHCLVLFRKIFNKSIIWYGINLPNPIKQVKLPTLQNQRGRFLTKEEAKELLEYFMPYKQVHDMSLLSICTGLRFKEITGIRGQEIDYQNELITILNSKSGEKGHVYMTPEIIRMLKKYDIKPVVCQNVIIK